MVNQTLTVAPASLAACWRLARVEKARIGSPALADLPRAGSRHRDRHDAVFRGPSGQPASRTKLRAAWPNHRGVDARPADAAADLWRDARRRSALRPRP